MRLKINFFVVIILVILCFPTNALASTLCSSAHVTVDGYDYCTDEHGNVHKVVYAIEEMVINKSSSTIKFGGYAFVEHKHNQGKGSNKNFSTWLIAYTGEWKNEYMYNDTGNNYRMEATQVNRDMSQARCFPYGSCAKLVSTYVPNWNSRCDFGEDVSSECVYFNVGFTVNVKLKDLADKLVASDGEIKFKIALFDNNSNNNTSNKSGDFFADFGVFSSVCEYSSGGKCSSSEGNINLETEDYQLGISKMSDWAKVAPGAAARTKPEGGETNNLCGFAGFGCKIFDSSQMFKIVKMTTKVTNYGPNFVSYVPGMTFKDTVFELASYESGGKYICSDYDEAGCSSSGKINNYDNLYAYGSWLTVTGNLTINGLKKKYTEIECNNINWNESINYNNPSSNLTANCGETTGYNQCKKSSSIVGYIYYPSSYQGEYSNKVIKIGNTFYNKLEVKTDVLLKQSGTFTFDNILYDTETEDAMGNKIFKRLKKNAAGVYNGFVWAGTSFGMGDSTMRTNYINNITWINAWWTSEWGPYYEYTGNNYTLGGTGIQSSSFNFGQYKGASYSNYCYQSEDGDFKCSRTLEDASFWAIDTAVRKKINENKISNDVKFEANDSNKGNSIVTVTGTWNKEKEMLGSTNTYSGITNTGVSFSIPGLTYENSYKYVMPYVGIKVAGNNIGEVITGSFEDLKNREESQQDIKLIAERWFVSFYEVGSTVPFNIKGNPNISLVSDMTWNLKGICDIPIKNEYYEQNPGDPGSINFKISYRTIDVENPFPKGNVSANWLSWWQEPNNKLRLSNTYENYPANPLYKVKLVNGITSGDKLGIKSLELLTNDYSSTSTIAENGVNSFVIDNPFDKKSGIQYSYCPIGSFSSTCDVTR